MCPRRERPELPINGVILGSFWGHSGVIWGHLGSFWVENRAQKYFNTGQGHQALVQAAWPWWPRGTLGHMLGSLLVAMDGRCTRTSVTEHQPTPRLNFLTWCKQPARGAAAPHPVRRATRRPIDHS